MAESNGTNGRDQKGWVQLALTWGFGASVAAFLIYFGCYELFLPMYKTHEKLVQAVSDTNKVNAETQKSQTAILERIDGRIERMPAWSVPAAVAAGK